MMEDDLDIKKGWAFALTESAPPSSLFRRFRSAGFEAELVVPALKGEGKNDKRK